MSITRCTETLSTEIVNGTEAFTPGHQETETLSTEIVNRYRGIYSWASGNGSSKNDQMDFGFWDGVEKLKSFVPFQYGNNNKGLGLFHKKDDGVYLYKHAIPYFKNSVNKSIGIIETADGYGTCFRVGERYIMTAYHVVQSDLKNLSQTCKVIFDTQDASPFRLESDSLYQNEALDVIVLEIQGKDTLPETLTLDTSPPPEKVDIFGYPGQKELQVDMRCPVYVNASDFEKDIKTAYDNFWKNKIPNPEACLPPTGRYGLHSSKSVEHGASGCPIMILKGGAPVVTMMFQGGTPEYYYSNRQNFEKNEPPLNYRFEYGLSMEKLESELESKGQGKTRKEIFPGN